MTHRRSFLKQAAALGMSGLLLQQNSWARHWLPPAQWPAPGLQLFTLFGLIEQDVPGSLATIASIGYKEIESAFSRLGGYYGMKPKAFAQLLKDQGLSWRSHHVLGAPFKMPPGAKPPVGADGKPISIPPIKNLKDNYQELVDEAAEGGVTYLVCANTPIGTLDEVKASIEVLNKTAEAAKKAGLLFAYHNHDAEFRPVDGVIPYNLMLAETDADTLKMELDIAWAVKAGIDPVALFRQHKGRFHLWHVKDLDAKHEKILEVGQGVIQYKPYFDAAAVAGMRYFFIEQDGAPKPFENIQTSYQYIHRLLS